MLLGERLTVVKDRRICPKDRRIFLRLFYIFTMRLIILLKLSVWHFMNRCLVQLCKLCKRRLKASIYQFSYKKLEWNRSLAVVLIMQVRCEDVYILASSHVIIIFLFIKTAELCLVLEYIRWNSTLQVPFISPKRANFVIRTLIRKDSIINLIIGFNSTHTQKPICQHKVNYIWNCFGTKGQSKFTRTVWKFYIIIMLALFC